MEQAPNKFALLIGIDHYGSSLVANLNGCVADVESVEAYLRDVAGLANIVKLTSPPSDPGLLPTLANIVDAFDSITAEVRPGDFVYLHFSGHGMRMVTAFPDFKTNQLDEALVLVGGAKEGIADGKLDYLRDVEMAYLLKRIADKGAVVRLVLDCCHSAGAVRASHAVRGVRSLPPDAFVAERTPVVQDAAFLGGASLSSTTSDGRGASVVQHWMSSSRGIEFLAACRTNQEAHEVARVGYPKHGLLSICLADVIWENRDRIDQLSCEMVYQLVAQRVRTHPDIARAQDVVFGGSGRRSFFGTESVGQQVATATITSVILLDDDNTSIVSFNAGTANGVRQLQRFALYPADRDFQDIVGYNAPAAVCRVIRVRDWDSDAQVTQEVDADGQPTEIQPGFKAVSVQDILYRYVLLPRTVRVVSEPEDNEVLSIWDVERRIVGGASGLVRLAAGGTPFFEVRARPPGSYTIEFTPDAARSDAKAVVTASSVDRVARYLAHLTAFYNLYYLSGSTQPRRGGISVENIGFLPRGSDPPEPRKFAPDEPPPRASGLQPFPPAQDPVEIVEEDTVGIRVTNRGYSAVYVELLDLEPSWKVMRIYPEDDDSPLSLSPNESADFFVTMGMPATVPDSVQPASHDAILVLGTANDQGNFPADVLPQLDRSEDDEPEPVHKEDGGRAGRGVSSPKWFAQRVDLRVVPRED